MKGLKRGRGADVEEMAGVDSDLISDDVNDEVDHETHEVNLKRPRMD